MIGKRKLVNLDKLKTITNFCEYYPNCYFYANEAYPNEIRCMDFTTEEIQNIICPRVIEENIKIKIEVLQEKSIVYQMNISKYIIKKD